MSKATLAIEQLLHSHPEQREMLRPYVEKANAYNNECGCSTAAASLLASLALLVLYATLNRSFVGHLGRNAVAGLASVFVATILGKLIGIGVARLRLAFLYWHLITKYQLDRG